MLTVFDTLIETLFVFRGLGASTTLMSDLNRGIMKFDGADKPVVVAVSAVLVLGAIAGLLFWGLSTAYSF